MEEEVKRYLGKIDPKRRRLAIKLRKLVLENSSEITEAIKWHNLMFFYKGNNYFSSTLIWFMFYPKKEYLNFGFFKGAKLKDPKHLLEGTGKGLRHIKIYSEKEINKPYFNNLIRQAMALNK